MSEVTPIRRHSPSRGIRRWWQRLGQGPLSTYAARLLITADCGGSNSARVHLWNTRAATLRQPNGPRRDGRPFASRHQQVVTASSTDCSPTSPRTGAASRSSAIRSSIQLIAATSTGKVLYRYLRPRSLALSTRYQNLQSRIVRYQHRAPLLPWLVELYNQTKQETSLKRFITRQPLRANSVPMESEFALVIF